MPPTALDYYPSGSPAASIYLDGLLCLCFNGPAACTIGVNNQTPSHALKFRVFRRSDCRKIADIPVNQEPQAQETFQIVVNKPLKPGPMDPAGVYVYKPSGPPVPGRHSYEYWLDMEALTAHNTVLTKLSGKLYPRFQMEHAFFSTYAVSESKFRFHKGLTVFSTLENIALAQVADIFHESTGSIEIKKNGSPILTLPALSAPDQYEIGITNSCQSGKCMYSETGTTPKDRNDFYLYYDVIDPVSVPVSDQLELINYDPKGSTGPTPLGGCISKAEQPDPTAPASDRTPCMAIVFGKSSSL